MCPDLEALHLSAETKNLPGIGSGLLVGSAVESSAGRYLQAMQMVAAVIALSENVGAAAPVVEYAASLAD